MFSLLATVLSRAGNKLEKKRALAARTGVRLLAGCIVMSNLREASNITAKQISTRSGHVGGRRRGLVRARDASTNRRRRESA
jgi:hypothetical protein